SVIQVNSINSVVSLEDVGFFVASRILVESGIGKLTSSKLRKDTSKLKKSDDKINIDYYYLRSLEKTTASEILVNPFVTVVSGYSLSLQGIKFCDWISSGDKPLIDVSGPLQYATIENVQVKKIGRKYGGPHILNLNLHPSGEAKINNVKFSSLSTNTDSKIAQIYGIEINPIKIFDHSTIPDTTSYHPLLQITNE
ncbi:MAG: hypothetical protein EZS28_055650, partial [Streblomastix strix]